MSSKHVLVKKREYASLKEDKLRLDYIEKVIDRGTIKFRGIDFALPTQAGDSEKFREFLTHLRNSDKNF